MVDLAEELEGTFKVPRVLVAFFAVIVGILVLFFPYVLNIMIAFFLIVWGLLKAVELGTKPAKNVAPSTQVTAQISSTESDPEPEQDSLGLPEAPANNERPRPRRGSRRSVS